MSYSVIVSECVEPFMELGSGCYYLERDNTMLYGEASDTCADLDSHLTYITSAEEQEDIQTYLETLDFEVTGMWSERS